jgi:hypothetical protein
MAIALSASLAACATSTGSADANDAVDDAWANGRSHVEVMASGSVARILGTRRGPSGVHEGFLLHLRGSAGRGLTVRVEDNVDLTGPIPLTEGPRGRHDGGYANVGGKVYQ